MAVVGAGYSGTIVAVELVRRGLQAVLIERGGRFAAGAAYGTHSPAHLLNVRAGNMSALDGAPDHFIDWLELQGLGGPGSFAARRDYHRYLESIYEEALKSGRLRPVRGEAAALGAGALRLADGQDIACDAVVLAGGNYPSRLPEMLRGPRALEDPWGPGGAEKLAALAKGAGDVLLLGTGLTMVDVALSLIEAGFNGRMVATSRRGLVPRPHEEPATPPLPAPDPAPLARLLSEVRARARDGSWRAAVDSLRPVSRAIWRGLSHQEKRRFLRHLRPWWDVHRHRIAPAVAARIRALREQGRLEVIAGRISSSTEGTIEIARRSGGTACVETAGIINCTGPEATVARINDPLIRVLIASGTARPDPLGIGLDVDEASRVRGSDGSTSERLYALGPLTRGAFWEIVAVPDIREQARRVADRIAAAY